MKNGMAGEGLIVGQRVILIDNHCPLSGVLVDVGEEFSSFVADLDGETRENVPNDKFVLDGIGVVEV